MDVETYLSFGLDESFSDVHPGAIVNGRTSAEILDALAVPGDAVYHPCPEAHPAADVPRGEVNFVHNWSGSETFPDTARNLWFYTSAGFDASGPPPALSVFHDGGLYVDPGGQVRVPQVFDSLVASGDLGPTIAVFVDPGRRPDEDGAEPPARQRSREYNDMSDTWARFLHDEVLPMAFDHAGCRPTDDPARRLIAGISSGGHAAFCTAWHRPDSFGLVMSHCGAFINIRGGHHWPYLIRSTERRPLRVVIQSGSSDAQVIPGDLRLANQQMASALSFAGYDHRFEFGTGGHNLRHGGAVFADTMRWLVG